MKLQKLGLATMVAVVFLLLAQDANAQFGKKSWMVEGSVGSLSISNSKNDTEQLGIISNYDSKGFSFSIYPKFGYFFTNDLAIGVSTSIGISNSTSNSFNPSGVKTYDSKYSSSYLGLSPFVRYYLPGKEKLRFYAELQGGVNLTLSNKSDSNRYNGVTGVLTSTSSSNFPKKYSSYNGQFSLGLNYFLAQNVALNTSLGYNYSKSTQTSNSTNTPVGGVSTTTPDNTSTTTGGRIAWNIGFTMFLGGNKSSDK